MNTQGRFNQPLGDPNAPLIDFGPSVHESRRTNTSGSSTCSYTSANSSTNDTASTYTSGNLSHAPSSSAHGCPDALASCQCSCHQTPPHNSQDRRVAPFQAGVGFNSKNPIVPPKENRLPHYQVPIEASNTQSSMPSNLPLNRQDPPNVIVFGETGTGKSSLINMLGGATLAGVSSQALGNTFSSHAYDISLGDEQIYRLWDTAGLNEGQQGTIPADVALKNLKGLVQNMGNRGVSLLVYCIRGTRFRDILRFNYDMFTGIICQNKVPVVLVITGLENETPNMDAWWDSNKEEFRACGLNFNAHACVTTSRGKIAKDGSFMFEEEYAESEIKVRELVKNNCALQPWKIESARWTSDIGLRMAEYMERYNNRTGMERQAIHLEPRQLAQHHQQNSLQQHQAQGHRRIDQPPMVNPFSVLLGALLGLMGLARPPPVQIVQAAHAHHRARSSRSSHIGSSQRGGQTHMSENGDYSSNRY